MTRAADFSPDKLADQRIYSATFLEDIANMQPSKLLAEGKKEEAIGEANREFREHASDFRTIICVGNVFSRVGNKEQGIKLLRETVALASNSRYVRLNFARHLAFAGNISEAVKEYEYLCKNFPIEWHEPRLELIELYVHTNKPALAAAQQKILLKEDPKDTYLHRQLAYSLARSGKSAEGFDTFVQACSKPKDDQCYAPSCRDVLDRNKLSQRKALAQLREAIELGQKQIKPQIALVEFLLYDGRFAEAKEVAKAALKTEPNNAYLHGLEAEAAIKMDDRETAENEFDRAAALTYQKHGRAD